MFYLNWGPYWWFGVIQMKEHSRYFWDLISSILYVIWDTDLFYTVTFGGLGCDWLVLCFDWSSHKWFSCVFTCFYIYTLSSIATGCDNDFLGNWHMHTHTLYIKSHILLIMEGPLFLILGMYLFITAERQSFFERRLKAGIQQLHESWKCTSLFRRCNFSEKATQFFKMMNCFNKLLLHYCYIFNMYICICERGT